MKKQKIYLKLKSGITDIWFKGSIVKIHADKTATLRDGRLIKREGKRWIYEA